MANFYIKRITVSGGSNTPSSVEFSDGFNIICGPSNTGKSYIIECLDYILGKDKIRLEQTTGYDTLTVVVQAKSGGTVTLERKFNTKKIKVSSTAKEVESGDYSTNSTAKNSISKVWLALIGIEEIPYYYQKHKS